MLSRRLASAATRPLARILPAATSRGALTQLRHASSEAEDDPGLNGNYPNPPAIKRQHRDPHHPWWDPQERRNYGEAVHEDDDVLAVFSPHDYTHFTPRRAFLCFGAFVATLLGLCGAVAVAYPDRPSAPRTFGGAGLEAELGGEGGGEGEEGGRG